MTNEEAIKYLRQIYPNGGHCWLDSQRIEAIEMAISALSQPSLPSNLDEAAEKFAVIYDQGTCDGIAKDCFKAGAEWIELRNRALEEAALHVYESWMGGTIDDVRRDMVELGKVLNARKED